MYKIIPRCCCCFVISAKNTFFGVLQNFSNYFMCVMRLKSLEIAGLHWALPFLMVKDRRTKLNQASSFTTVFRFGGHHILSHSVD